MWITVNPDFLQSGNPANLKPMILSFINQKGGVGKSTLSINAADCLTRQGAKVLLIDADPQKTTSDWAALREDTPFPIIALARENMAKEIIAHAANYDHVVIDGPPRSEHLGRPIIIASDLVVLPIEPSGASDWASAITIRDVKEAQQLKEGLQAAFLVSRAIRGTVLGRAIREHVEEHGIPILEGVVTTRIAFAEAMTLGQTIYEYAPESEASQEISTIVQQIGAFHEQDHQQAEAASSQPTATRGGRGIRERGDAPLYGAP